MVSAARPDHLVLLLPALFLLGTAATDHGGKDDGLCIQRGDEVSAPGSCLCYDRCSNGGGLANAESQLCFVSCVLRFGCVCPSDGDLPPAVPNKVPSAATAIPALLNGALRVTVTRPLVSRSRNKDEAEEVLVVEVSFEDDDDPPPFGILVNAPEGKERQLFDHGDSVRPSLKFSDEEKRAGKAVLRSPIGDKLEKIGADGDETIVVTFWPLEAFWFRDYRLTIDAVRIEYDRKNQN